MNNNYEVHGFYWAIEYLKKTYPEHTFYSYFNGNEGILDGRDVRFMREVITSNDIKGRDFLDFIQFWLNQDGFISTGDYRTLYKQAGDMLSTNSMPDIIKSLPYIKQLFYSDEQYKPYRPLIILVGAAGTGKSTIADMLEEKYGLKVLKSYTDRLQRENDKSHTFVTEEEFKQISWKRIIAYTYHDGHNYCGTVEQIKESDVYVIDEAGIDYFLEHYNGDRQILVIRIDCNEKICRERMAARGDSTEAIEERIAADRQRYDNTYVDYFVLNENNELEKAVDEIKDVYDKVYYEEEF